MGGSGRIRPTDFSLHSPLPPSPSRLSTLPSAHLWLAHWILFAASCNIAGWTLSLIHSLNLPGFAIAIPSIWWLLAILTGLPRPKLGDLRFLHRWKIRKNQLLPLGFALLVLLALAGGLLHAPNNYDALNYRMPKVAHWLMAGRWEWIPANNNALNTRSSGFEWLTAPMIALLRTDRLIFLFNLTSFLFLPGLVFSLFRRMGATLRTSRAWMWVLPAGYCFALQAGSVSNDLPAAMFALAAFDFGFRWRKNTTYPCFALALASAAMMTAIKPTTLPLLLPFAVLFIGMWKPALSKPFTSILLAALFALASFLPTAALNFRQCGDWTGAAAENPVYGQVRPLLGLAGNLINTPIQNLAPPIFPLAGSWNASFPELFPQRLLDSLATCFEPRAAKFGLTDIQGEESAGIGLGICALWIYSIIAGFTIRGRTSPSARKYHLLFTALFGAALLVYFSKTGMNTVARHIAPYYPFLIAIPLLAPSQDRVVRSAIWKWLAAAAMASTVVMVVITPSRPLWPAHWFFSTFTSQYPSPSMARAAAGFSVYAERADALGNLRDALPADAVLVGLLNFASGPELPLWKPYLHRQVRHIRPGESITGLTRQGMAYVILNTRDFKTHMGLTPEQWLAVQQGTILKRQSIRMLVKEPPSEWWTVQLPKTR